MLSSPILYHNTDRTVTLIDIATSIAAAQARTDTLLSTPPLQAPIEPREDYQPRSQSSDAAQHAEYKHLIEQALAVIRANVSGPWCSPRRLLDSRPPRPTTMDMDDAEADLSSRLRQWAASTGRKAHDAAFDLQKMMASLGATYEHPPTAKQKVAPAWAMSYAPAREAMNGAQVAQALPRNEPKESWTSSFHNPEAQALDMQISERSSVQDTPPGPEYRFTIPPRSTFFLTDFTHSDAFRASFRDLTDEFTLPRHFDLVLLDPPWPNRSAKRKQGTYEQVGGMPYLKKMLLKMDLDTYLEHNALVGVWITNKSTLREHVLGSGGLFETWNVGLIEEWVWIKTTTQGEPMFDIDSPMRKPYEVFLLGRAARIRGHV